MGRSEIKKERTTRPTIWDALEKYDYIASDKDYIEVTRWSNGEGIDVYISSYGQIKHFSITDGELKAIRKLAKELDK